MGRRRLRSGEQTVCVRDALCGSLRRRPGMPEGSGSAVAARSSVRAYRTLEEEYVISPWEE